MAAPDLSDFDEFQRDRRAGQRLRVDVVLAELPDDKAASLDAALRDVRYSPVVVSEVVQGWGVSLSSAAVRTWRRRHSVI